MNEIYAIYDTKAQYYMPFFVERNHSTAERAVENALRDRDHQLRRHSEDYKLFHLGTWDPESGIIDAKNGPQHVADCWVIAARIQTEEN